MDYEGERVHDEHINRLTIIANESCEDFAATLQTEFEQDCSIIFGKVDAISFSRLVRPADAEAQPIGQETSRSIWEVLVANGYLAGGSGGATRKFDPGNPLFELALSQEFAALRPAVVDTIQSRLFRNRFVEFDSEVERQFARDLDDNENVKLFVKLPRWFRIDTPIGPYNPDWAFVTEREERLYFVRETKSTPDSEARRTQENQKTASGKRHFEALEVDFDVVTRLSEVAM